MWCLISVIIKLYILNKHYVIICNGGDKETYSVSF